MGKSHEEVSPQMPPREATATGTRTAEPKRWMECKCLRILGAGGWDCTKQTDVFFQ